MSLLATYVKFSGSWIVGKAFAGSFLGPKSPVATCLPVSRSKTCARICVTVKGMTLAWVLSSSSAKAPKVKLAGAREKCVWIDCPNEPVAGERGVALLKEYEGTLGMVMASTMPTLSIFGEITFRNGGRGSQRTQQQPRIAQKREFSE